MLKDIGAAVAAERIRRGLRTDDLGIDARIVEDLEAGRPGITTTQLETVAATLQIDPIALRSGTIVPRPTPSVYLLHRGAQDFDPAEMPALDAALEQARARNELARLLGNDVGLFPSRAVAPRGVAADGPNAPAHQGYQLARELRQMLGNEADPLDDLCALAESVVGVVVLVRRLVTIGSAAFAVKSADSAAILLAPASRARENGTRVRIAHELCHLLFDLDDGGLHVVVDYESDRQPFQAEQRARAFAAELLLPEAGLRQLLGAPGQISGALDAKRVVSEARDAFGSTWQVAANHLCNLHFIDLELRRWLESLEPSPPARSWTTSLPREGSPSLLVEQLVRRAHEVGHLTDGEARTLLGIDRFAPLPWDR
ncbi:MAG: ImmA/IrrE family metallo-endopeptidase [Kofleriaceae bacterium]